MELILSYFTFDIIAATCLLILLIILLIQLYFYQTFYKIPVLYYNNTKDTPLHPDSTLPSVSVIIVAKNESENLAKNLPAILNQNYPDYEVVVVNDGSTDESENLLKDLKKEHPHLYSTFSPVSYANRTKRHKLLSLTIGIKAASKDLLLFTEADTTPIDKNWITSMAGKIKDDKEIVLGYCRYNAHGEFWSKISLFDNLLFSLQYFSMAIKNKPYTGVYRNIAFRKNLFFDNKGFSSSLQYDNAEDVFLNQIMTKENTTVALSESSFVSCDLVSFSMWKFIKANYLKAKSHFKNFRPTLFSFESTTRLLFYLVTCATIVYTSIMHLWLYLAVVVIIFFVRFLFQYCILRKASEIFQTKKISLLLPFMDIMQSYYNSLFLKHSKKKGKWDE